jgi:hypothetical protein
MSNKCVFVTNLETGEICGQQGDRSFESRTDPFNEDEQVRASAETVRFCPEHWEEHLRLRGRGEYARVNTRG